MFPEDLNLTPEMKARMNEIAALATANGIRYAFSYLEQVNTVITNYEALSAANSMELSSTITEFVDKVNAILLSEAKLLIEKELGKVDFSDLFGDIDPDA